MKDSRQNQSELLLTGLTEFVVSASAQDDKNKQSQATMAALLLKKQFLDERTEEEGMWQITNEHAVTLKNTISASLNFGV